MARIINQNKEVIAIKDDEKKAAVSPVSLIVGIALSIAALAVIIVVILFLTKKDKESSENNTTPLIQYIDNYKNQSKSNNKFKVLKGFDVKYELEKFRGECYILVYNSSWMKDTGTDTYKAYEKMDSALTGSKTSDGKTSTTDPLLPAIENCGQDISFFVIDYESVKKRDDEQDRVYFTLNKDTDKAVKVAEIKAPMFFHFKSEETYTSMYDEKLYLADGSTGSDGKPKYRPSDWVNIIRGEVNYVNGLTSKEKEE